MKRSFWITLLVSVTVCIAVMMTQAARNKSLAQRIADEQARPAPGQEKGRQPARSNAPDPGPSQERIDRAVAELSALAPEAVERSEASKAAGIQGWAKAHVAKEKSYMVVFLEFLRSVEGLSVDELVTVAGTTSDSHFRKWLLLLAAEQDPMRVYRSGEWKDELTEIQMAEALARVDPAAALALIPLNPPTATDGPLASIAYIVTDKALKDRVRVANKLLGSDVERGLQAFLEIQENLAGTNDQRIPMGGFGWLMYGTPRLPKESVPDLLEAMGRPEYAAIRGSLIERTLTHTMLEGGVPAFVQRAEAMQLTPGELKRVTKDIKRLGGLETDPVATMEWISGVRPGEVPSALVDWAELDLTAATDWLGAQEPSPARDQAIARFATEASELDQEGAAAWAREIQDEKLRIDTLQKIGENF